MGSLSVSHIGEPNARKGGGECADARFLRQEKIGTTQLGQAGDMPDCQTTETLVAPWPRRMMHKITEATALENYRLDLVFDDSTRGIADLSHLAGKGIFST